MDRFLRLPLPQQLLVVGVGLALLGGATYYLLLSPISESIGKQARQYKLLMGEYAKLKEYDSPEFKEKLELEKAESVRKRAEYAKLLPREEELPALIESIKSDADATGLILSKFQPSTDRNTIAGPGYRGMAFNIEVAGTFHQLVDFFQALSAPSKRIVLARQIDIRIVPPGSLDRTAGDVGLLRILHEREQARGLTPNEKYAKSVLLFEEIAERSILQSRFQAIAYVYTGGPAGGAM
jgi:Tfp pilus assembly protein PilO